MMNFNTNQARHFYVAKAKKDTLAGVSDAGDLAMLNNDDYLYFVYKNMDGAIVRSDTIPVKGIEYYNKRTAAQMATKLMAYTIAFDTTTFGSNPGSAFAGKTLTCNIAVRELISYDPADSIMVTASVKVTSAMDSTTKFNKALASAIAKALPKREYPYFKVFSNGTEVTASTDVSDINGTNVVLVATPQKWVRGKLSGEPFDLAVSFNVEDEAWGTVEVAPSEISNNTVIAATYKLADLEYFCLGERGDVYRGYNFPNDYTPTYVINPADTSTNYDVLTIQYFWQGKAETIQKSPRTIHIAGPAAAISAWKSALDSLTGNEAGSGSGSGS